MEMRPELRRVYARATDLIGADPSCAMTIGYLPLEDEPETVCMDFGPASVEGLAGRARRPAIAWRATRSPSRRA